MRRLSPSPSPPRRRSPSPIRRRSPSPILMSRGTSPIRHRSLSPINRSMSPSYMAPLNRSVSPAHMESHRRTRTPPPDSPTREQHHQQMNNGRTRTVIIHSEPTTSLKSALRNSRSRSRSPVSALICQQEVKSPTYENVFASGVSEDVIVYENCGSPVRMDIKFADAKSKLRKRWSSDTRSSAAKKTLPKTVTTTTSVKSKSTSPVKEKVTVKSVTIDPKVNLKTGKSQESIVKKEKVKITKEKKSSGRGVSAVREHKLVSNSNESSVRY